jgi:hypothetical protein
VGLVIDNYDAARRSRHGNTDGFVGRTGDTTIAALI